MRNRRGEAIFWVLVSLVPYAIAAAFSAGASSTPGSFYFKPSIQTLSQNFSGVTSGDAQTNILVALTTSVWLSLACSFVTILLGIGAGISLSRMKSGTWLVTAAFVGSRAIPITAALPTFAMITGALALPKGLFVVGVLYVLLFLPLATALLSGARWQEATRVVNLLELDRAMSSVNRAMLYIRFVIADVAIAAITVFLLCWSEFFLAAFLLEPGELTLARYFASFETINGYTWGTLGAAIVLSMIPAAIALTFAGTVIHLRVGRPDEN